MRYRGAIKAPGFELAEVGAVGLSLEQAVAGYVLSVEIRGTTSPGQNAPWRSAARVLTLQGWLKVAQKRPTRLHLLAPLVVNGLPLELSEHDREQWRFGVQALVDARQLAEVEHIRDGGPLTLRIELEGVFTTSGPMYRARSEVDYTIDRDTWLAELQKSGFADTLVLEVAFPTEASDDWRRAKESLAKAQRALMEGRHADVVAAARHAIEATQKLLGEQRGLGELAKRPRDLDKGGRQALLRAAALQWTHPAHHEDDASVQIAESYDRHDAVGILAVAAALVRWASLGR